MTATTIFFDGRLTAVPGVETRVDASALEQVGLGASGVVGLIGTAVGGRPVSSSITLDQFIQLNSPRAARDTFRSGDLREACSIAFEPSTDAAIPGGAQSIIAMKVNQATQSTLVLSNGIGDALTLTSEDWGAFTEQISVSVATASAGAFGRLLTVVFEATTESGDGVGQVDSTLTGEETAMFQLDYEPTTGEGGWETMTADALPAGTVRCYGTREDEGQSDEVADVAPGAFPATIEAVSSAAGDTTQTVTVYGLDNSVTPVAITETLQLNGVVASPASAQTFSKVLGATMSAAAVGTVTVDVSGGGATCVSFGIGVTARGVTQPSGMFVGNAAIVLTTNDATPNRDGATATADVVVSGLAANGAAQVVRVQVNAQTFILSSVTWSRIDLVAYGEIDQATGVDTTIHAIAAQTNSAHDTLTKVQDYFNARQVDNPTLGAQEYGFTFTMRSASTGLDPALLDWTNTPTNIFNQTTHAGFSAVLNAMVNYYNTSSDLVTAVRTAFTAKVYTLQVLTNAAGSWVVNVDGTAVTGAGGADADATAAAIVAAINTHPTVSQLVTAVATSTAGGFTITGDTARTAPGYVVTVDAAPGVGAWGAATPALTTAQAGSGQAPDNVTNQFLAGGSEGAATFDDYQEALDQLRKVDCNTIVVLTGDPSVHLALEAHCAYMGGAGKSERDGIVGLSALDASEDPTGVLPAKASIKSQILSINSRHVRACAQTIDRPNTAGVSTTFMPWFQAVGAAGMQAGSPVGTSLTRKTMKVTSLGQDSSWDPVEDAHEMILSGLWFMEAHRTGRRCVRNITTYLQSVNLAFVEASVNEAVNFTVFNFRNAMETVVGEPGFAGTLAAGKSAAQTILNLLLREGTIVQWRALSLTLAADVMDVSVEVAPIIPVNFVRATVHLVTLSQAA